MSDLKIIKAIEEKLGVSLKVLTIAEAENFKRISPAYCVDENGHVTRLWLAKVQVDVTAEISKLSHIIALDLNNGLINDIGFLKELKHLNTLYLISTNITDLSVLQELKNLNSLDLRGTAITDISVLQELKHLNTLYLGFTNITDLSALKELKNLNSLDLGNTKITDISELKELKNLNSLYLRGSKITDLSVLKELKNLNTLYLSYTKITDLSVLKELKNLNTLYLSYTKITDLSVLKELKNLNTLYLAGTAITDISVIQDLPLLSYISLENIVTLDTPPKHIIEGGMSAIRNFFAQQEEQGVGRLFEAKVLIVGDPGSGKSSLRKKLIDPLYEVPNKDEPSTLGVEVHKNWAFPYCHDPKIKFQASIWDFGGQDIQYMIHQYFLTGKCLYILVADERRQNTHYQYWFNIIQLLGEGSPVLVVLNKKNGVAVTSYDHKEVCKAYPDLMIEEFELDMASEPEKFLKLQNMIENRLCNLKHIGDKLPAKWPIVRDELKNKHRNHISLEEYLSICNRHGIKKEEDALFLSSYLYALGEIIHFKDDPLLRDLVILNPNWVVDALYKALSHEDIKSGHFTQDWIFGLWKKTGYSTAECHKLLSLMNKEKFELCYKLEDNKSFIYPQLLEQSPPAYNIDFSSSLNFRFRYSFMPEGIISRLIVRLNHLIHKQEERQIVWRHGALFAKDSSIAEVKQILYSRGGHREISVRITGADYRKKELFTIINTEIEAIHRKSFPNIHYDILIPCNSNKCLESGNPELFVLNKLSRLVKFGHREIPCTECGDMINIHTLVIGMVPDDVKMMAEKHRVELVHNCNNISEIDNVKHGGHGTQSEMIAKLLDIIHAHAKNPSKVDVHNEMSVTVNLQIKNEIQSFKNSLDNMNEDLLIDVKDDALRDEMKQEIKKINKAIESIASLPKEDVKSSRFMERIDNFIKNMKDADTNIGKVIKILNNGQNYVHIIAKCYNAIVALYGTGN